MLSLLAHLTLTGGTEMLQRDAIAGQKLCRWMQQLFLPAQSGVAQQLLMQAA